MMATATCHTPGCENAGIPIEIEHPIDEDTGQPATPWQVVCGPCQQPITDVSE